MIDEEEPEIPLFPVVRLGRVKTEPNRQRWLIQGLWAEAAVGCIGGTPKSGKTWLALEMAMAVASGTPCLGRFGVPQRGTVLLYAAEDTAEALRDRAVELAKARQLDLDGLPIGLITEPALRLDVPSHQSRLSATVEKLRPRLLVLDPLVRLHRSDENSSSEISELLGYLRTLQRQFGVAIAVVHHVRKSGAGQPGQSLRGSGDLHAWGDSNLYLLRRKGGLQLHAEHRSHPSPEPMGVELVSDPTRLEVCEQAAVVDDLEQAVITALSDGTMSRTRLRERVRVRNERLGEALTRLEAAGRVCRSDAGWSVPRSHP
jgi:RecA-family ATPase